MSNYSARPYLFYLFKDLTLVLSTHSQTKLFDPLAMEDAESTTRLRTAGSDGNPETNNTLLSGKPLHRFVQREPRCIGVTSLYTVLKNWGSYALFNKLHAISWFLPRVFSRSSFFYLLFLSWWWDLCWLMARYTALIKSTFLSGKALWYIIF